MMNYAVNRLLERKNIFADLVNGALFGGKDMLHPENMELLSPNSGTVYRDENGKLKIKEYQGDIRMRAAEEHFSLIVAGEPQDKVHYAMPVRIMEYVAMEYRKQVQDLEKKHKEENASLKGDAFISGIKKEDRIAPVIAIVLYCDSENEWDGSRSLGDMMDWGQETAVVEKIKKYWSDFQLNIIHVKDLGEVESFKTSLQYIFGMVKYSKDKVRLREYMEKHGSELSRMDKVEATAVFALLGQQKMVENMLLDDDEDKGGGFNVCVAIDEMIRDGEMVGENRGIKYVNELAQRLFGLGRADDFLRSTVDAEYQRKLFEEFDIH